MLTGTNISHYRILEKLGAGGMGVVYKADDEKLNRQVALKFLAAHLTTDQVNRARFIREARSAAALSHPNICTVYEVNETQGILFIAMELCEGQQLRKHVHSQPMPLPVALPIIMQIADALSMAHQSRIIHRDIKSSNIIVDVRGRAKLLDFGLASLSADDNTQTLGAMGTPHYIAPECFEGAPASVRSDLWSLGIVLYEVLTGHTPFSGTRKNLIHAILNEDPAPVSSILTGAPAEIDEIIVRALAKDPSERYQTAEEMLADLSALLSDLRTSESPRISTQVAIPLLTLPSQTAERQRVHGLAVLPFVDMSGSSENAFLCDGLTEELINALTQVKGLRVVARASAFQFRSDSLNPQEVGRRLRVGALVLGSVRRSGDRIRVTAQLVKVSDGYQIWSQRFEGRMREIFEVQDELTDAIVESLRGLLGADLTPAPAPEHTSNFDAHELYLRGRYSFNQQTGRGVEEAARHFSDAINLAPSYALAHVGLADCFALMGWYGFMPSREAMPRAKEAALNAIKLNEALPGAHSVLGTVYSGFDWDWTRARQAFQKAFSFSPVTSDLLFHHALDFLTPLGRLDEAFEDIRCALDLDPVSPLINTALGGCLYRQRRYNAALKQLDATVELTSTFYHAFWTRARVLESRGDFEEALKSYRSAYDASGASPLILSELGHCYARMG
ncbi:MAG: Serine/threonine-protein kinase PrkC, partial [Bryobacterales bacterium]|nr:Serine/threonine-protein kinase PrkC [Bryobacterales bacterium]